MPDPHWENLKEIFHAAVALVPTERSAYLDRACDGNALLRQAVESLIKSHEQTGFVDQPAYQAAAQMLMQDRKPTPGQTIGRYRIVSLIGEGGMGRVYLAEDTKLHRKVSLKFLSTNVTQDRERLRRFEQEARAASALNHPNIITIYEIGEEDGHQFIATEFIEGQTLRERLSSPLDLDEALDIAIQAASALVAAHRVNIVHRDIKPENIMIRKDDGLVKVLDFGLAKITVPRRATIDAEADTELRNTAPGVVMGTVAYMSPEQARGETVDERTDIWSLGVVLYEMVAGCSPFVAGTSNEIISAILSKEPPPPLTRHSHIVPERLEEIVEKALAKNKDERYQTSKDLLIDLKRLQQTLQLKAASERSISPDRIVPATADGQGAVSKSETNAAIARPASSVEYIVNQIQSHKRAAIVSLAVLVLTLAGAFIYLWRTRQFAASQQPEIRSLAVLPLKSLDTNDNYVGLGIADAVIRRVSQTGKLIVRPTSAVRRYLSEETDALSAAKQLGVDSVLEGTVQRANDRLRVSVNLLRTIDGTSLWTESFDMSAGDIFTIQDTVSQQVAARLRLQLDPAQQARLTKRSTSNPVAYEYYVKGVNSLDQRGFGKEAKSQNETTINLLKNAVDADPNFALAHAQLAYAYVWMALFIEPTEQSVWAERGKEEINRAQALDPQLAETHIAYHRLLWSPYEGWQTEAAIRETLLAQQLNPNVGHTELADLYYHLGLEDLAEREFRRALDIDPTSEWVKTEMLNYYANVHKYEEANTANQKFYPGEPAFSAYYMAKGRLDEAQKALDEAFAKNPNSRFLPLRKAVLFALKGDFRTAEADIPTILGKENRNDPSYHHVTYEIACVYALAGKSEAAVKWLRETVDTGFVDYPLFERDPYLNRVRQAPEFIQFMAEMKKDWERYRQEFGNPSG